ncbi:M48 family metalloprotease [Streptomyces sp. NPDC004232]|uniref:M48 family metalloprotease n=1 Tax=Streptomyces sp. NPDC004232 TaxID=3154454 RepID=UPI001D688324|nr:M48 family metalloprotease [Streptomyces sp. tea 10]
MSYLAHRATGSHVFVGNSGYRKGPDYLAYLTVLLGLPTALLSGFLVALIGALFGTAASWVVPLVWFGAAPLVALRQAERAIARRFLGYREPTEDEHHKIGPVFAEVCSRAAVDPARYQLWVAADDGLFARAFMGHSVVISAAAVERLSGAQLAAVISHEIGHVAGYHTFASSVVWWWGLPARVLGTFWSGFAYGFTRLSCALGGLFVIFSGTFVLAAVLVVPWYGPVLLAAAVLARIASRGKEYRADDYAARLGFAPVLAQLLRSDNETSSPQKSYGRPSRLLHLLFRRFPSPEQRLLRIKEYLGPAQGARPTRARSTYPEPTLEELRENPNLPAATADIVNALQTVFLTVGPPPDAIRADSSTGMPVPSGGQQ